MPKNIYLPKDNLPKIFEVREVENEVPSYEEFIKTYKGPINYAEFEGSSIGETKGYGPCRGSLCGCSCSSNERVCKNFEKSITDNDLDTKFGNFTSVSRRNLDGSAEREVHVSELTIVKKILELEVFRQEENFQRTVRVLKVVNYKSSGVQARVGLNVDSGFKNDDDAEVKFLVLGFSAGKKTGISTPLGAKKLIPMIVLFNNRE
ncbi:MAG: hypothetical protein MRERC_12c005 [Mycoplasmataceae bacterium RC_NB112A]|nr:MAG: hypothetical protein MRERC_12c005 [Mycoplasmataceae bacterium RC_NB112A]